MTRRTFILRSLRFHARSHLGALLGATVGSAVLIGALIVGDSVRGSLRDMALARLGRIELALHAGDRFFRSSLAALIDAGPNSLSVSALQLKGMAINPQNSFQANHIQVNGVTGFFYLLSPSGFAARLESTNGVVVNERLANQLKAVVGESIVLRVGKPSGLSAETPFSPSSDSSVAIRLRVEAIVSDSGFGRFSLSPNQMPPFNAFVNQEMLQEAIHTPLAANLLLIGESNVTRLSVTPDLQKATTSLRQNLALADLELELRRIPEANVLELRSRRVFLDPPVVNAARKTATNVNRVLTYFVNELRLGERATPYSMVTAMGPPVVPADMRDDEMVINEWLADDLYAQPGDELELKYFVLDSGRRLEERTARLRVHSIVPLSGAAADRSLMPDFPGLDKAESTRDWDPSLPVSLAKVRPKDEEYWKQHRGTPKAFVTLAAGEKMWSNRFGVFTGMRFPLAHPSATPSGKEGRGNALIPTSIESVRAELEKKLLAHLDPAALGLRFEPVREQALAAANQSQDFGGLFLGFSFFLIVAALLLMALLFQFSIEQRATEIGTLLALGFTPKQVRRLLLFEGGALALIGGAVGVMGGVGYARGMLHGLSTVWRDAVGTSSLGFHAQPTTFAIGLTSSVVVAWFTIWLALRRQASQPARELLAEGTIESSQARSSSPNRRNRNFPVAILPALAALGLITWALSSGQTANAGVFFGAGSLCLVAGLAFCSSRLSRLASVRRMEASRLTLAGMGVRSAARRRSRSLSTLGLLACGSFLIASIGVFRLDAVKDAGKRSSGTGGFALIGESTVPVVHDLNAQKGREFFGLDAKDLEGVQVVPLRVRDGDDASCLNLNRAQKPRLLGVNPELLNGRGAFSFSKVAKGLPKDAPWTLLRSPLTPTLSPTGREGQPSVGNSSEPVIPAIGDANSIQWSMGRKVGDTIDYADERGRPFKVRIVAAAANSVLQGSLLIDETAFVRLFPSEEGHRMFLIDAPSNQAEAVSATLSRALRDRGLELTSAARRLAAFNAVQNTYLGTFQILGGLGLLLGSAGLGVVVMRNVFERRGELALLLAVGLRGRALKWMVLSEHGALLLAGLGIGVVAAAVAVLPTLLSPGAGLPYGSLGLTLVAVLLSGALWTWLATMAALRGRLVDALRNE